jgi:hypothetical protein
MRRGLIVLGVAAVAVLAWVLLRGEAWEERVEGGASGVLAPRAEPDAGHEFVMPTWTEAQPEAVPEVAESARTPAALAESLDLEVRVIHADGAPAAGCVVVLAPGEVPAWSRTLDSDGRGRGLGTDAGGTLWVGGATLQPVAFELPRARGRHELVLPAGEVIDGRVVIDGGPPPESFILTLEEDGGDPRGDAPWRIASALVPTMVGRAGEYGLLGQVIEGDGAFRFSGLPAGWTGRFRPEHPWHAGDDASLSVTAPARGLLLELRRVPRIRFRVVSAGDRSPEPFAGVTASVESDTSSTTDQFLCDALGRADVPMLRWDPAHTLGLDLANNAGTARRSLRLAIEDCTRDLDLGDIELSAGWTIPIRVLSRDRTPLAGARAATECGTLLQSGPTDAEGRAVLAGVPPDCPEMRVAAERHEPACVALPPAPPSEALEVVLQPCAWLDLVVASVDGQPRPGLHLVRSTQRHLDAREARSEFLDGAYQSGVYSGGLSSVGREDRRQPDGSTLRLLRSDSQLRALGRIPLGCVEDGATIDVSLVDRSSFVVWSSLAMTVPPGTTREELALLDARPHPFELLVTDAAGAPVEGVDVGIKASAGRPVQPVFVGRQETTGADGRATFDDVYAPLLDVRIEREGYVEATHPRLDSLVPQHLVLSRGLVVTLHGRTPSGRAVPLDAVWVEDLEGGDVRCEVEGVPEPAAPEAEAFATWRLGDLPPRPVVIRARVGGRDVRLPHDPQVPEARLEVPEFGSLTVNGLAQVRDVDGSPGLRGECPGDATTVLEAWVGRADIHRGSLTLPVVFPGEYRITLSATDSASGEERSVSGTVEVRAGETASVTLR